MPRRKGFWKDMDAVFDAALEMVGGTYPPDEMRKRREEILKFKLELKADLKAGDLAKKIANASIHHVEFPAKRIE